MARTTRRSSTRTSVGAHGPRRRRTASSTTTRPASATDLIKFVDQRAVPLSAAFRQTATGPHTIEYKIGEIFTETAQQVPLGLHPARRAGGRGRPVLQQPEGQRHELSDLYETRIRRMGNAGRNGGEYYTPRPLIRAMIKVDRPQDRRDDL